MTPKCLPPYPEKQAKLLFKGKRIKPMKVVKSAKNKIREQKRKDEVSVLKTTDASYSNFTFLVKLYIKSFHIKA